MIHIGQIINELLYEKKISKAELARSLEVTPQSIGNSLKKNNMGTDYLQRIMKSTGIKSYEIFNDLIGLGKVDERAPLYGRSCEDLLREERIKIKALEEKVELMEKLIEQKEKLIEQKDEMIVLLKEEK